MARPVETRLTISCLQCDWSVETTNTSVELSASFLEAAQAHAGRYEQHAIEIVQRLRVYSANYVEPPPPRRANCSCRARPGNPDRLPGQDPPPGPVRGATSKTANGRN